MRRILAVLTLGAGLTVIAADTKEKKETRSRQDTRASTMTGCVDQRGATYILTKKGTMDKAATLRGRAFSDDNFARFIGHEVKVTGDSKDGVLHVDRIEKIAETCH